MEERLVVCFRYAAHAGEASVRAEIAVQLQRVKAQRARVAAWFPGRFAVDYPPDALKNVLDSLRDKDDWVGFAIGMAMGPLGKVSSLAGHSSFTEGPALSLAARLANLAREGEVIVGPGLVRMSEIRLLTLGRRRFREAGKRVFGFILDREQPVATAAADELSKLEQPAWLGGSVSTLKTRSGGLSLLVAQPGLGGTYFLQKFAEHDGGPSLFVGAYCGGEPLGSLRFALARVGARSLKKHLNARQEKPLEALLSGRGLGVEPAADLVQDFFLGANPSASSLVLLDRAENVDADTLSVVEQLAKREKTRVLARVLSRKRLPEALTGLDKVDEVRLSPLSREVAHSLVEQFGGKGLGPELVAALVARSAGSPLAIRCSLQALVHSGSLVFGPDGLVARTERASRKPVREARRWIVERLDWLDSPAKNTLFALAVLGGGATRNELDRVLTHCLETPVDVGGTLELLDRLQFAESASADVVVLPSETLRHAILSQMSRSRRVVFHQAASAALVELERPAPAAMHALLSGNVGKASLLARRAAAVLKAADLQSSADCLSRFGAEPDLGILEGRGLSGFWLSLRRSEVPVDVEGLSEHVPDLDSLARPVLAQRAAGSSSEAELEASRPYHEIPSVPPRLSERLRRISEMPPEESGAILRDLREAKSKANGRGPSSKVKAALALAVALAAAGRDHDALLEVLDGLARARQAQDERAVRACARLLAQLSRSAGHERAAQRWDQLASEA